MASDERRWRQIGILSLEFLEFLSLEFLSLEFTGIHVLRRVHRALRPGGWHFASFKGGEGGHRDSLGRFYSYIPRARLEAAYRSVGEWKLLEMAEEMGGGFDKVPTWWLFVTARRGS